MTPTVILAGGAGRRMGGNKPFHPFGQSTLIETVIARLMPQSDALYINAGHSGHRQTARLAGLGLPILSDEDAFAQLGPLSGVLSAMSLARQRGAPHVITAPCDMPNLPEDLIQRLLDAPQADAVFMSGLRDHPLCARWSATLEHQLRDALQQAQPDHGLPVMRFLGTVVTVRVPVSDETAFFNINHASQI